MNKQVSQSRLPAVAIATKPEALARIKAIVDETTSASCNWNEIIAHMEQHACTFAEIEPIFVSKWRVLGEHGPFYLPVKKDGPPQRPFLNAQLILNRLAAKYQHLFLPALASPSPGCSEPPSPADSGAVVKETASKWKRLEIELMRHEVASAPYEIGEASTQNLRKDMEDRCQVLELPEIGGTLFAVCDGHNGSKTVDRLISPEMGMPHFIVEEILNVQAEGRARPADYAAAFVTAARRLQTEVCIKSERSERRTSRPDKSGSVGAWIVKFKEGLFVLNVGDCRVVRIKEDGAVEQISYDHKPRLVEEQTRIQSLKEALGEFGKSCIQITPEAVKIMGSPATVTRSFGEKCAALVFLKDPLTQEDQSVSILDPTPFVTYLPNSEVGDNDDFAIFSDGVSIAIPNDHVPLSLAKGDRVEEAAAHLVADAKKTSTDNIGVLVIRKKAT